MIHQMITLESVRFTHHADRVCRASFGPVWTQQQLHCERNYKERKNGHVNVRQKQENM